MPYLLQAKQQLDDIQELYWKLQSSGLVTELNSTLEELVWASDIVRSRAFAISKREGTLYVLSGDFWPRQMYMSALGHKHKVPVTQGHAADGIISTCYTTHFCKPSRQHVHI